MTKAPSSSKRQSLSKKTRFEVFKRDAFKCQYCGAHPPSVLLHVDHINPVALGGKNDVDNLVTACEACNQGKGARSLNVVPETLESKATAVSEREEQLRGYHEILEAKRQRLDDQTWEILWVMDPRAETVPRDQYQSVKTFIEKLGYHVTLDAMEIAMASPATYKNVFKYFCGVCWNRIRELDQ